jgi:putative MATE family efflux protein
MGLVAYILWVLPVLFQVVSIGALAVVARLVGGGQRQAAAHATRQALLLGVLFAAAVLVLVLAGSRPFVAAMGLRGEAARLVIRYIWIIGPAVPFIMLEQVGSACLRGSGDTYSGMLARIVLNLVNTALSTALVTGAGLFPQWGWDGLAVGAAVGHAVGGSIILARLVRGGGVSIADVADATRGRWRYDWLTIRRILGVGVPGGLDVLSVVICHLIYVGIINRLGVAAQAAHGLGVQIEALSYLPGSAFQVAAATLAGQSLGAADHRRAVRSVLLCVAAALTIMTCAGLVLFFAGDRLAVLFLGRRSDTAILVGQLLKIVALSCPALAVLMVLSGALRGSGDTAWPLAFTFIGLVGIRIPGACLLAWDEVPLPLVDVTLPGLGLGVAGAWWAMVADVSIRSLLAAARFTHGGWQRVKV